MDHDKPVAPASAYMTLEEKAAADRARLYAVHKARGSLGTYYYLYPDERPRSQLPPQAQSRDGEERER